MIVLRTLGSSEISAPGRPDAAEVLAQPKRFALLIYLTLVEPRGFLRRDSLLALFWPETDQARGRQVLRQTVYLLRQRLGADVIVSRGGEELGVDRTVLRCDVAAFEEALAQGQPADALEQYRGDFLAGLHVPDSSPELEEWMSGERRRLRGLAMGAASGLAAHEERAGNTAAAIFWARRAAALDPTDERGARDLVALLARVGDRAGAVRTFDDFSRRLRDEVGVEPGPEISRLVETLRERPRQLPPPPTPMGALPVQSPMVVSSVPSRAPRRRLAAVVWGLGALALLGAGMLVSSALGRGTAAPLLAVGPITTLTEGDTARLSTVTADLLSTSIARLTGVRVVPVTRLYDLQAHLRAAGDANATMLTAAQQAGASQLLQGTVHRDGAGAGSAGLQLDLEVIDLRSGRVVHAMRASGTDMFSMVDDATTLVARAYGAPSPPERIADVTTQSLLAYRLFDEGLQAYAREDPAVAYRLFQAALKEDSSFAMAAFYAGVVSPDELTGWDWAVRAARLADRATDRERLWILQAAAEALYSPTADAVAETLAVRYPDDPEASLALGNVAMRRGDFGAAAAAYRRVIIMDSLSIIGTGRGGSARCAACEGYRDLFQALVMGDSLTAAARVAHEWARRQPERVSARLEAGIALERDGRFAESRAEFRAADSIRPGSTQVELQQIFYEIRGGDYTAADSDARRLMHSQSRSLAGEGAWFLTISLRSQGRWREALAQARAHGPSLQEGTTLLEMGEPRAALAVFRGWDARIKTPLYMPGFYAKQHAWMLTHEATCLAAAGDTAALAALADSVAVVGSRSAFGRDPRLHHYVRGLLWRARGDLTRAATEFRASIWSWTDGYTRENYELARTLVDLGRPLEAIYPLQAALRGDLQSSNLYITRTELHELLARAFAAAGRRDSAAAEYRQVAAAWRRADPVLRDRWAQAQAQAAN